ncbi:MAG: tellurite resistance TerB family protein, partial [Natronospirillum sp.]
MNSSTLIDQLLRSGSELLQGAKGGETGANQPSQPGAGSGLRSHGNLLGGAGGGLLAGGVMGLLMSNKKMRKAGGKVAMYGGLTALGAVAYKAYSNYQKNQAHVPQGEPQTVDRLPPRQVEQHSEAILLAVIGAAKADGHINDRERELIDNQVEKLSNDEALTQWFDQELRTPVDPAHIAKAANTPEMAAEMYLASLFVVDEESFMEKAYL